MLTEFPLFCAENLTADADEISETDIVPILTMGRFLLAVKLEERKPNSENG